MTERLRTLEAENASLRRRLETAVELPGTPAPTVASSGRAGIRLRAAAAVVLIALGALLAPVAVVAAWVERTLTDTDRYVATVAPLAEHPVLQSALAGRLTGLVMEQIDVGALLEEVSTAMDENGIAPRASAALGALEAPLTNGVQSFVREAADRVVQSDQFETVWEQANRTAHEQMVAVMQGADDTLLQIGRDGQLTIQLAPMIDLVKERLVEAGLGIAGNIPQVNASFTIMQTSQLVEVQNRYAQVVALGTWLPWVALILLAGGVLVASHRLRTLMVAGLALAGSMVVLGLGLTIARGLYLDALIGVVLRLDAAEIVFDQVVSFLRLTLRTVGVLGLVVAIAAYLGGSTSSARALRAGVGRGLDRTRAYGEGRGVSTGPVGLWLGRYKGVLRAAVVIIAALVILLAGSPTPALIIWVAVVAVVLLVLLELLSRTEPGVEGDADARAST
ncbi:hypothetical protein EXU48_01055 [Occultella glacieicola]|uniref:Integral membrane protein n=1 Tax=Occultella glacieicola TaxID=2518684 RepID=A0ABY2E8W0_9MICO|nr:hypothetical protein [Occultella glacieicola]TDE98821.1 hypothetical protein EXU48_01055 [Occultella glacieicola]